MKEPKQYLYYWGLCCKYCHLIYHQPQPVSSPHKTMES